MFHRLGSVMLHKYSADVVVLTAIRKTILGPLRFTAVCNLQTAPVNEDAQQPRRL